MNQLSPVVASRAPALVAATGTRAACREAFVRSGPFEVRAPEGIDLTAQRPVAALPCREKAKIRRSLVEKGRNSARKISEAGRVEPLGVGPLVIEAAVDRCVAPAGSFAFVRSAMRFNTSSTRA